MTTALELRNVVSTFVEGLAKLARQAALDELEGAFAAHPSKTALPSGTGTATAVRHRAPVGRAAAPSRGRGRVRRATDQLENLQQALRDHVRRHPGQRVAEINAALSTMTQDIRRPLAKLISAGELRTTGNRRTTRYFPT